MPVVRTIRNHKYQILSESPYEIKVIDKSNGVLLCFSKIEGKSEEELGLLFPEIPVLKYKKNGYFFLDIKIKTDTMCAEVFRFKKMIEIDNEIESIWRNCKNGKCSKVEKKRLKELEDRKLEIPSFTGKISHTNLMGPAFEGPLKARTLDEALLEITMIRELLPKQYQANIYGKKLRKAKVIKDGRNIKIL